MLKVADVMSTRVVSVERLTPLKDVARLLVDNGISGVPVIDEDGSLAGVVSEGDLLVKAQGAEAIRQRPLARWIGDSAESRAELTKLEATSAGEAMTSPAVTIGANPVTR